MDPLSSISAIAASGMRAQGERLKVVSENVANADSTGNTPGADAYRRKTLAFEELVDREMGASMVKVEEIGRDKTPFALVHDPAHPAADAKGMVKMPNVNPILEMSNMREASRSYEANMNMFEAGRDMRTQMLDLLR
ncbi:flagellar basal body rod protein FlgC [Limimaricola cinnabarinus]|jgi:flagellar basal-body rod protein FlgC|uniref:Flagellar basal-body rod protein FlgC n=1 Tax=Limimaricola cinnabarinus LL-001 TaxID=1337093 RepID=U3AEG0_9RHOB|nr:flagellar basal body rod protein FlgC [Limimaricola cinnabarinus]GAD56069.1 flagellar basal-body rod protein flgC [Limimaricola cinnabarinus LL-001]